jgi:aspartokinase-like uncharacterized kinase
MRVIKLGGSLSKSQALAACLKKIADDATTTEKTVIVPGGGDFAEQVRIAQQQWQFNDEIAHEMAILAMQQMALLFKGLQSNFKLCHAIAEINQATASTPLIWSPSITELNTAGICASWNVTSDSLAAWLATQLAAKQLILVKAAPIASGNLAQLSQQGIIDSAFAGFVAHADFTIHILNQDRFYEQSEFNREIVCSSQ